MAEAAELIARVVQPRRLLLIAYKVSSDNGTPEASLIGTYLVLAIRRGARI